MAEIQDLQAKVDSLTAAATQSGVDFSELTVRVDTVIAAITARIPELEAANADLTAQRDTLSAELGADHAAVTAANSAIDANVATINALGSAMDAFQAEVVAEPPAEGEAPPA
jgi:uncharacterized coiled-coil protein SlyX